MVLAECISGTEQAFVAADEPGSRELGLTNSNWGNPVGWPDAGVTYTTARDLAKLAAGDDPRPSASSTANSIGQPNSPRAASSGSGEAITQGNRNPILGRVQGADGLKTGHTEEAGYGFTGSAEQNGRRHDHGGRRARQRQPANRGIGQVHGLGLPRLAVAPAASSRARGSARPQVQLGSAGTVGLVAPRNLAAPIPAGAGQRLRAKIVYQGPVKAPIAQGQHVADLIVQADGMPAMTMPLVAENEVGEAGFFGRIWAGLKHLLGMG